MPISTRSQTLRLAATLLSAGALLSAAPLAQPAGAPTEQLQSIAIPSPTPPDAGSFDLGSDTNPQGSRITLNGQYLIKDGKPWMPVMGEFHFTRYPESEWRDELLKMKAGGVDIVATYVFWIHHEEIEGQWNWKGNHDLRRFVELCGETGMLAAVRCGPWCHGEVRNGGLPEWLLASKVTVRSDDPAYLAKAHELYGQIAAQLKGLYWKDGGPVIALQLENEYGGPAEHLLTLKKMARELGMDAPLYTRTGWPALKTPMPYGKILPLFGAYAEGFWDRELVSMPPTYWPAFRFLPVRTDAAIANEQLGKRQAQDEADAGRYPYLTCELGGGMISSYHRRIRIEPADLEAVAVVKIGAGGNMPGYYMYHGGTNPDGQRTTLMECQDSPITNWNDMPVKGYDFYAPLGEYGQVRPHYHSLRRLHLMVRDFGERLATMKAYFPETLPLAKDDLASLRWALRSNGVGGFVFVNNHHRSRTMPPKPGTRFSIALPAGGLNFPSQAFTVPTDASFIWPFRLELGHGVRLEYATAQPLCSVEEPGLTTVFFAAEPLEDCEFAFAGKADEISAPKARVEAVDSGVVRVSGIRPGRSTALEARGSDGSVRIVLLSRKDSLELWKGRWQGRERVLLCSADELVFDHEAVRLRSSSSVSKLLVVPAVASCAANGEEAALGTDGVFQTLSFAQSSASRESSAIEAQLLSQAGPARNVLPGKSKEPVAAAPTDEEFKAAAKWRIKLPVATNADSLLRLRYRGDAIRVYIGGRLITDDYSNGRPLEIGLWRHKEALARDPLEVWILPLRADAPIFIPDDARPRTGAVAELTKTELLSNQRVELR